MTTWSDVGLLSPVRAGTPVEAVVSDRAWLRAMLDAESALARAQARLGTLPPAAARTITSVARAGRIDTREIALAARETANPVVALVRALTRLVAEEDPAAAEFVHRGSTSQDILDTGAMLVTARALRLVRADLERTSDALAKLSAQHRDTPMAGRTLALHAVPTTFGLKAAGWRQLVLDARDRVDGLLNGGLPVSLGGAAGTMAGYLEHAAPQGPPEAGSPVVPGAYLEALSAAYAEETGLARTLLPWHALRTPLADLAGVLSLVAGALGKLAVDVQFLARTEVAEVGEPAVAGRGASSAMPHKRNPVLSTMIRAAALQVPSLAAGLSRALMSEDERSAGTWHAEWLLLRECLRLVGGATHTAVELVEGLVVHPERMLLNLGATDGRMAGERIAAVLTPFLGRSRAKELLTEASLVCEETGRSLAAVLGDRPEVRAHLDGPTLAGLSDAASCTGGAGALVDRALGTGTAVSRSLCDQ